MNKSFGEKIQEEIKYVQSLLDKLKEDFEAGVYDSQVPGKRIKDIYYEQMHQFEGQILGLNRAWVIH